MNILHQFASIISIDTYYNHGVRHHELEGCKLALYTHSEVLLTACITMNASLDKYYYCTSNYYYYYQK